MPIKESVIGGWQLKEADCPGGVETLFQLDLTVTGLEPDRKRKKTNLVFSSGNT